jgi:phage terminase large subunit
MKTIDHSAIAAATYAAMCAPPSHVVLAQELLAATSREDRQALLALVDDATRSAALGYIAEPEATRERDRRLAWMRADPRRIAALKTHYSTHVADFISDHGQTIDPRLIAKGKSASMPFILWPKQRELVEWTLERWQHGEAGVVVKSRDVGASWVAMAVLGTLCIFNRNFMAGIASATEVKLDRSGDPDTLFHKLRTFLQHLPPEFNGGWSIDRNSAYLRISFPETDSSVTGEAGDQAGRGGRKSLYIVDEYGFFEHPKLIDASLSATADTVIHMSSVNGVGNSFYEKAHNAAIPRFDITWRDDPRKDQAWYDKKVATTDPVILAQEVDCNFTASVEGVVIPSSWVQAAIGLHEKLGIKPTGARDAALDVADRGADKNAFAVRHGIYLEHVQSWSGKDSDIYATTARAFRLCDEFKLDEFAADMDGLGAGVRGDARVLNEAREPESQIFVSEYRGSASPLFPESLVPRTDRTNENFYSNRKAQSWWHLRFLFQESYKASQGLPYDPEALISINPKIPELSRLVAELSQATVKETATGKLQIEKVGDGTASPNLADAVVMAFAPRVVEMKIDDSILAMFGGDDELSDPYGGMTYPRRM